MKDGDIGGGHLLALALDYEMFLTESDGRVGFIDRILRRKNPAGLHVDWKMVGLVSRLADAFEVYLLSASRPTPRERELLSSVPHHTIICDATPDMLREFMDYTNAELAITNIFSTHGFFSVKNVFPWINNSDARHILNREVYFS